MFQEGGWQQQKMRVAAGGGEGVFMGLKIRFNPKTKWEEGGGGRKCKWARVPAALASGTSRNPSKFQSSHDKHFDSQM